MENNSASFFDVIQNQQKMHYFWILGKSQDQCFIATLGYVHRGLGQVNKYQGIILHQN